MNLNEILEGNPETTGAAQNLGLDLDADLKKREMDEALWLIDKFIELAAPVIEHAQTHYDEGWDEIVECYSPREVLDVVYRCRTAQGAIRKMAALVADRNDYRNEIVNA